MTSSNDIQRELAQLREENARLKELLRKHGIAYEASTSPIVPTQKLKPQLPLEDKVRCFGAFFEVEKMCLPDVGIVRSLIRAAISLYARGNGIQCIATRRNINVRNVRIASFSNWDIPMFTPILKERTRMARM